MQSSSQDDPPHPDSDAPQHHGAQEVPNSGDVRDDEATILIALAGDPIADDIRNSIDKCEAPLTSLELHTEHGLSRTLDDIAWNSRLDKIRAWLNAALIKFAVIMHTGATF